MTKSVQLILKKSLFMIVNKKTDEGNIGSYMEDLIVGNAGSSLFPKYPQNLFSTSLPSRS